MSQLDKKTQATRSQTEATKSKFRPQAMPPLELHGCMGLNACKGHDYFGTNDCAGMGECATNQHSCHTLNNCRGQGGCGLFGTKEEQCKPGMNDCAFQGSCGTPIPASRFVTQGPNKGQSVWLIARALFEKRMKASNRSFGKSPMEYGPTLEWLGNNIGVGSSCGYSGERFCSYTGPKHAQRRHKKFVKDSKEDLQETLDNCKECDC